MAQMIVSPKEMRAFARDLGVLAGEIAERDRRLQTGLMSLHATWRDQRYRKFEKAAEVNSLQLQIFFRMAQKYCDYLGRKASAAERYLSGS